MGCAICSRRPAPPLKPQTLGHNGQGRLGNQPQLHHAGRRLGTGCFGDVWLGTEVPKAGGAVGGWWCGGSGGGRGEAGGGEETLVRQAFPRDRHVERQHQGGGEDAKNRHHVPESLPGRGADHEAAATSWCSCTQWCQGPIYIVTEFMCHGEGVGSGGGVWEGGVSGSPGLRWVHLGGTGWQGGDL